MLIDDRIGDQVDETACPLPRPWANKRRCPVCQRLVRRYRGADGQPCESCRQQGGRLHLRTCPSCGRELRRYHNSDERACSTCLLKDRKTLGKWRLKVREERIQEREMAPVEPVPAPETAVPAAA